MTADMMVRSVFSNILLTNDGQVRFIDMRGMLGDELSLSGDIMYDLAKVYQSCRKENYNTFYI